MRGRFSGGKTAFLLGAAIAVAALTFASGATGQTGRAATLPNWHSLYDWTNGDGYAGWHSGTSSPAGYGLTPALGGKPGLWLWANGGQHLYTQTDYAEWTYTAPGTTRLARTTVSFSYRNTAAYHQCIDIGFRTALGAVVTHQDLCRGAHSPNGQGQTSVQLADPSWNPTSTVLYVRIHVDCGGASACQKAMPQLDPLRTGDFVRLLSVDSTLVDDDNPVVQPSGALSDLRDHFIDGTQSYGVTAGASDAGAGIFGSSLVHTSKYPLSLSFIGAKTAPCDPHHNTVALDARNCPASFSWDATVATLLYPEGPNFFTESALDAAGHLGVQTWTVSIDRTPPDSVVASGSLFDLGGQTTDGSDQEDLTITAHDPGADTQRASGIARVWYEEVGVGTIASSDNPDCTDLLCPDTYSAEFSVDLSGLSDGPHTFVVKASDLVGHVTVGQTWTVTIVGAGDQVAPDETDTPPATAGTTDAPGGGADGYDATADQDPACDAYVDVGTPDWCSSASDSSAPAVPAATPAGPSAAVSPAVTNPVTSYAGCGLKAVFWTIGTPTHLLDALTAYNVGAACGDYYIAVQPGPSSQDQPVCLTGLRGAWPSNFHAAPVFQWSAWAQYVNAGHTWYQAGVEFRNRMDANGCQPGDRWFVNELPSSWHSPEVSPQTNMAVRARIANALRGLYHGGAQPDVQGYTADVVLAQDNTNMDLEYKPGLKAAYAADDFWRAVGMYVQGFGKEVYNRCSQICVEAKTAAQIADNGVNNYSYHESWLAAAAPSTSVYGPVKTTLRAHNFPLLNAVWNNPAPVFDTRISVKQMARVIRQQIYSARRIAATQVGAAGRIGFAWKESGLGSDDDAGAATQLAANLAIALRNAYQLGGTAAASCVDNDGADTFFYGCPPVGQTAGAFNPAWNIFKTW
jgi:hypothetical protein